MSDKLKKGDIYGVVSNISLGKKLIQMLSEKEAIINKDQYTSSKVLIWHILLVLAVYVRVAKVRLHVTWV